jgi:hypothetical protein
MNALAGGTGVFKAPDPDGFRRHTRDHKERRLTSRGMSEHDAIERFVQDGDYLSYDCNVWKRGPATSFPQTTATAATLTLRTNAERSCLGAARSHSRAPYVPRNR